MRRFIIVLSVLALSHASLADRAEPQNNERAVCEGYCAAISAGCYFFLGAFVGNACDKFYQGCVDGCIAAIVETEDETEGR